MNRKWFLLALFICFFGETGCVSRRDDRTPYRAPQTEDVEIRPTSAPSPLPKAPASSGSQQALPLDAHSMMQRLGLGFNLGNIFDREGEPVTLSDIEAIIDLYQQAGFQHVRIPITWLDGFEGDHLIDANGNLQRDHPRFLQLVAVIQYALEKSLYVIINSHHEKWLKEHYQGEGNQDAKFARLWQSVASYFADYPQNLLFEVLNEPEGSFGDFTSSVSPFMPDAIQYTRRINEVGYEAIRRSHPGNAHRIILVMPNGQGNQNLLDEVYPSADFLPGHGRDAFLAVSVHSYDPWNFCGQDGANSNWPGADALIKSIQATAHHAKSLGVAAHFGEYGVGRQGSSNERNSDTVREYYRTMTQAILQNGMAATVWDDRGWFALVEKDRDGRWHFLYDLATAARDGLSQRPANSPSP